MTCLLKHRMRDVFEFLGTVRSHIMSVHSRLVGGHGVTHHPMVHSCCAVGSALRGVTHHRMVHGRRGSRSAVRGVVHAAHAVRSVVHAAHAVRPVIHAVYVTGHAVPVVHTPHVAMAIMAARLLKSESCADTYKYE